MSLIYILLAILSGACLPVQAGANAKMREFWGHALGATLINFIVGLLALLGTLLLLRIPWPSPQRLGQAPWWAWIGGLLGATMVALAVFLSPKIGTAALFASLVLGQMGVSLLVDHYGLLGLPVREINLTKVLGVGLLIAGVVLVNLDR